MRSSRIISNVETFTHVRHPPDIDNRELERVKRVAKQEEEWEARALAQEREQSLVKDMEHKAKVAERLKRLQVGYGSWKNIPMSFVKTSKLDILPTPHPFPRRSTRTLITKSCNGSNDFRRRRSNDSSVRRTTRLRSCCASKVWL